MHWILNVKQLNLFGRKASISLTTISAVIFLVPMGKNYYGNHQFINLDREIKSLKTEILDAEMKIFTSG